MLKSVKGNFCIDICFNIAVHNNTNTMSQQAYTKPIFTEQEIEKFEKIIDSQISKGYQQICLSTGIVTDGMARLQTYLGFHYPSGSFSTNPNFRNYRVAKNGKKYTKRENW